MNNKNFDDGQELSLFDGHEDMIQDIEEANEEAAGDTDTNEAAPDTEGALLLPEDSATEEGEAPYYDEGEVVMADEEDYEPVESVEEKLTDEDDTAEDDPGEDGEPNGEIVEVKAEAPKKAECEDKPRRIDSLFDFIELFVFTLAAVFIITSFFFKYSNVVGDSMQNTLQNGEKLILTDIFYTPKPGDVVIIDDRTLADPIVKRVIAVGGQRVRITRDAIYVDGQRLTEDYVYTADYPGTVYRYSVIPCDALVDKGCVVEYEPGEYYEILIPDNEIFVMGDHRNNSYDSRDIGTLHEDSVLGKVVIRFFPFDKFGKID